VVLDRRPPRVRSFGSRCRREEGYPQCTSCGVSLVDSRLVAIPLPCMWRRLALERQFRNSSPLNALFSAANFNLLP
jgi:hypothetical protein